MRQPGEGIIYPVNTGGSVPPSAHELAMPAVADMNVNTTLETWWQACTQVAADFLACNFWQVQAFAIGLTEATLELRTRCCSRLLSLHGSVGEVGIIQCQVGALSDARRFSQSETLQDVVLVNRGNVPEPRLDTWQGQAASVVWYCSGYMHHKADIYSRLHSTEHSADTIVPRLWHYGPLAKPGSNIEWQQYKERWQQQMKVALAWAGRKDGD